jgi:HAE1 family hydrophobic/amphiphilic exporter-1
LYQQLPCTIAISVILPHSMRFTLSPALAALLLKPKNQSRGLLRRFSIGSTANFDALHGYVRWSGRHPEERRALVMLVVFGVAGVFLRNGCLPASCG